jgi:hypothetical protein
MKITSDKVIGGCVGAVLAIAFGITGNYLYDNFIKDEKSATLLKALVEVFSGPSVYWLGLVTVLSYKLWMANRNKQMCEQLGYEFAQYKFGKDPRGINYERSRIWKQYFEEPTETLYILGATALNTLALNHLTAEQNNAPLFNHLNNLGKGTKVRVMMIDPRCEHFVYRVEALRSNPKYSSEITVQSYLKQIIDSVHQLKEWKDKGKEIEWRFYRRPVIWKLVVSDQAVWQQTYPANDHVEMAPVNVFSRPKGDHASNLPVPPSNHLYFPFRSIAEQLWDQCEETKFEIPSIDWLPLKKGKQTGAASGKPQKPTRQARKVGKTLSNKQRRQPSYRAPA